MSNWTNQKLTNFLGLIMTDEPLGVLVGTDEDKILVWNLPTLWTDATKHSSTFINQTKN
jgi:hypothetical protein